MSVSTKLLAVVIGTLVLSSSAFADDRAPLAGRPASNASIWIEIPPACQGYMRVDPVDAGRGWSQLLSLGGCVQDASIAVADAPEQLQGMVAGLSRALAPAMVIYLEAIRHGPDWVKLRAAYHVGMAYVALMTRARASLVRPPGAVTTLDARYHELHASLEPLLAKVARTAWIAFATVDRAATEDASLSSDPVARYMIASAREMLELMRATPVPVPDDRVRTAR